MRRIVRCYRISKFKYFLNGMIFACISTTALTLCINDISIYSTGQSKGLLPFFIAIISMLLGLVTMFHHKDAGKEKLSD